MACVGPISLRIGRFDVVISLKRLTTPLFYACNLPFRLLAPRSERRSRTADHCSLFIGQYGYCRLDVAGGSPELSPKKRTLFR